MLVNLVPEFLAILAAPDPTAAYHEYLDRHKPVLQSYWHNYVLDPTSPHAEQVIAATLRAVRYTSPTSRADLKRLVTDLRGYYNYWDTGSRATLRELLANEGAAVAAAQLLDETGLGLRLRFLSGGMSPAARLTAGKVLPERSGYYLGLRLVESYLAERGLASTVRAAAQEFKTADERALGIQTA